MKSKLCISAGGILLVRKSNETSILIGERVRNVEEKWAPILRQLPKGNCEMGETLEQTALREVLEETGYNARIIRKAGEVEWSYKRKDQLWDETVHYFFMEPVTLISQNNDNEFDFIKWINIVEASKILSYPQERELLNNIISKGNLPDNLKTLC